jgi:hypothetical protein
VIEAQYASILVPYDHLHIKHERKCLTLRARITSSARDCRLHRAEVSPAERRLTRAPRAHHGRQPVRSRSPAAGYPRGAAASGAGADAPTSRITTYGPGSGPDSEHAAEWAGPPALVLPLLHDFPDPGRSHRFLCSSPPRTRCNYPLTCDYVDVSVPRERSGGQFPQVRAMGAHVGLRSRNGIAPSLLESRPIRDLVQRQRRRRSHPASHSSVPLFSSS